MEIIWKGTPHHFLRKRYKPIAIVMHIADATIDAIDTWFQSPHAKASAHYAIGKNGKIHQYVNEKDASWSIGGVYHSSWRLCKNDVNPNFYTISIQHEGKRGEDWTDAMYEADTWLIGQITKRWDIPLDRDHIMPHSVINTRHHYCPGPGLDFTKLFSLMRANTTTSSYNSHIKSLKKKQKALHLKLKNAKRENRRLKKKVTSLQKELREVEEKIPIGLKAKIRNLLFSEQS